MSMVQWLYGQCTSQNWFRFRSEKKQKPTTAIATATSHAQLVKTTFGFRLIVAFISRTTNQQRDWKTWFSGCLYSRRDLRTEKCVFRSSFPELSSRWSSSTFGRMLCSNCMTNSWQLSHTFRALSSPASLSCRSPSIIPVTMQAITVTHTHTRTHSGKVKIHRQEIVRLRDTRKILCKPNKMNKASLRSVLIGKEETIKATHEIRDIVVHPHRP